MSSFLGGYDPINEKKRINPNLGKNPFGRWARSHFGAFSVITVLAVCVLKTVFSGLEPLVTNLALMVLGVAAAYFLGFNKIGIGRTTKNMGRGLALCLPLLIVALPMLVFSFLNTASLTIDHNVFDMAYYVLYFLAMAALQMVVMCGMLANLQDRIHTDTAAVQKALITPIAVWSLFYLLNFLSASTRNDGNAAIAQMFGCLLMSLFLCSVFLRTFNLYAVVIGQGVSYCLMAGLFIVCSSGYSVLTSGMDTVVTIVYLALHLLLLIPYRKNMEAWQAERLDREDRLVREKQEASKKKETGPIRRGVRQKHNR